MNIIIDHLIPFPLREKIERMGSEVWNTKINLEQGKFIKITAPSGTGKTTFIHQLYGLRNDYNGTIFYDSKNIQQISADSMATIRQSKLSVVFQDLRLLQQLTAFENIQIKRALYKPFVSETEMLEMIEYLGIKHILQQPTYKCSYGEQQRIAIIRALMQPFDMLLMDEPFSHLDNSNIQKAVTLIQDACTKRNAGFVLTDLEPDTYFNYHQNYQL